MCAAKVSAKFSDMQGGVRSCANCINYGWTQPTEESRLLRCSKCKFISYCSKECQQEHWVKVHKQHCKYLAEQKVMPKSRHDPVSCPGCMKQTEIGPLEMSNADNPSLGCPLAIHIVPLVFQSDFGYGSKISAPLPFQLGEMTGQFLNKTEHTVSLLAHLLHKMKVTKHAAWTIHPEARDNMSRMVSEVRQVIWDASIYSNPGHWLDLAVGRKLTCSPIIEMLALTDEIDEKLRAVKFVDPSVFRPWDTFKLLLNILQLFSTDILRKEAEMVGLPEMSEDVSMCRVTSAEFSDMWMKVLDAMPGKLVLYTDLLKIVCGGQLSQVCFGCNKDITVAEVLFTFIKNSSMKVPFNFQSDITASFCGDPDCNKKVAVYEFFVRKMYTKISFAASGHKCDNCALPGSGKIHRCAGCLTKLYCGVQCRDEDWKKVHKLVCKKGEERKMKGGKEERNKEGIDLFDEFVEYMKNLDLNEEEKENIDVLLGFLVDD